MSYVKSSSASDTAVRYLKFREYKNFGSKCFRMTAFAV